MKTLKIGVMLLALLLAAMIMVPMASAAEDMKPSDSIPANPVMVDINKIIIPHLQINDSQPRVVVNYQFDVSEEITASALAAQLATTSRPSLNNIPYGSIIYHSKEGITRVFDQKGKQVFSAIDKESPMVFTPGGIEKPATFISSVPNGAFVNHKGNITYVNDKNGNLILTVINEYQDNGSGSTGASDTDKSTAQSTISPMTATYWQGWVEDAHATVNQITQFDAYWNVPTKPPAMESGKVVFLFNGITTPDQTLGILQPVLAFYPEINGQNWYGEAWAYCDPTNPYGHDVVGQNIQVLPGDPVKGRILRTSDGTSWYVEFDNLRNSQTSYAYSNVIPRTNNLKVTVALEAGQQTYTLNPLDNTDMPGRTEFSSMAYKYNGNPISGISLQSWYNANRPSGITNLNVNILNNPGDVMLHTANG